MSEVIATALSQALVISVVLCCATRIIIEILRHHKVEGVIETAGRVIHGLLEDAHDRWKQTSKVQHERDRERWKKNPIPSMDISRHTGSPQDDLLKETEPEPE